MGRGGAGGMEGLGCHRDHDVQTESWLKQCWVIETAQTRHRSQHCSRAQTDEGHGHMDKPKRK